MIAFFQSEFVIPRLLALLALAELVAGAFVYPFTGFSWWGSAAMLSAAAVTALIVRAMCRTTRARHQAEHELRCAAIQANRWRRVVVLPVRLREPLLETWPNAGWNPSAIPAPPFEEVTA